MQLLVSVRSATEAEAALEGGADVIDVKEPSRGSLGRADDSVIAEVVRVVAGRRSVSAAMGELLEKQLLYPGAGLTWIKWGLAGVVPAELDWCAALLDLQDCATQLWGRFVTCHSEAGYKPAPRVPAGSPQRNHSQPALVTVAYADAERAGSPAVEDVCRFACGIGVPVLLLDTWKKDGSTLLDWLTESQLRTICEECRQADVRVALAGSLRQEHLDAVLSLNAWMLAVRGAVCEEGERTGRVETRRVKALVRALRG